MGYYVSNMIGIRTGGIFSGETDIEDMKTRIRAIITQMHETDNPPDIRDNLSCMSSELNAHKGSYVVIAGVFNYWRFDEASVFAAKLSEEFGTEVMIMSWDMESDQVDSQIYLDGKPLFEVDENSISRKLRRIG